MVKVLMETTLFLEPILDCHTWNTLNQQVNKYFNENVVRRRTKYQWQRLKIVYC